jgi:hypothetical protein
MTLCTVRSSCLRRLGSQPPDQSGKPYLQGRAKLKHSALAHPAEELGLQDGGVDVTGG